MNAWLAHGLWLLGRLAAAAAAAAAADPGAVAARVDGDPIRVAEVQRELAALARGPGGGADPRLLRAEALKRAIDRRLALHRMRTLKLGGSEQDADLAMERLEKALNARGRTLRQYLEQRGLDEAQLRTELAWRIGWRRCLDRYLTDENLQRYFEQHREEFDGTRRRVAHILIRVPEGAEPAAWEEARRRAAAIRRQIATGQMSFAEAAAKHSDAPTADAGGRIGWIERHDPMPEPFSAAAFQLQPGQISQPVTTALGVHLIQCLEVAPGNRPWTDVRQQLEGAVRAYLFRWLADSERKTARVERTGAWPIEPGEEGASDAAAP